MRSWSFFFFFTPAGFVAMFLFGLAFYAALYLISPYLLYTALILKLIVIVSAAIIDFRESHRKDV
jgi:hypothetical protein